MGKCLLGIDIGGGSIRCAVYDLEKKSYTIVKKDMSYKAIFRIGDFGYGMDTEIIWNYLIGAIKECLSKGGYAKNEIISMSISTLRHTIVVMDKEGKVLFASPNRDARAVDAMMTLNDSKADAIYNISGHRPLPNLMACKLLWLKDTNNELYNNIATSFSLSDYLNFRLTGKIFAEKTHAGETMLFDLKEMKWSDELIRDLGLRRDIFPEIIETGVNVGTILSDVAVELGLSENTIVASGAGDTQSGLLGLGITEIGATGIVAGTTAPIQMVIDKPVIDTKKRIWTGVGAIPDTYVLESNGGGMGIALEWIAGMLFNDNPRPIAALMASATKSDIGAGGVISTIGAAIFNNSVLALPIDQMFFSTTNHKPDISDRNKVARAVIEGMAFAIRANVEQLIEVSENNIDRLYLGGGISRDAIVANVISDVINLPVVSSHEAEISVVGAIICAAYGASLYKSLADASKGVAVLREPVEQINNSYEHIYEEWKDMYRASFETNMTLGALINELRSEDNTSGHIKTTEKVNLRIYVDADLSNESVEMLREFGSVTHKNYRDGDMLEGDEMILTLKDYDVFITEVDIVDAEIIKQLPNLRMVGVCRGNPTNIDIDACTAAGIPVVYTPGRNSEAVADLTIAHILNLARMIPQSAAFLKEEGGEAGDMGRMGAAYFRYQGMELWRKTVGLIGGGAIGKKVAKRLLGFDANIIVYDPYISEEDAILMGAKKVDLDYLLAKSDFVSMHAPVTEKTKNMIDRQAFAKMKDGAYFINTARAALVDNDALIEALKSGKLKGAGLDVFDVEPPAWNDPLVQMENVLSTPHIAGNTIQVSIHQGIIMADNIRSLLKGEMSSDVINRKDIPVFSFRGEKVIDNIALEKLSSKVVGVNDLDRTQSEKTASTPQVDKKSETKSKISADGYEPYMLLIKEFLNCLASDDEVKEKTRTKDISFQITFKDNEESCYMYFKGGDVMADLGVFPHGAAEVNLRMPIEIFDGMMRGTVNGAKAAMTGKMSFTGNVRKAMSMQSIMKLMMGAYENALSKVGGMDVTQLDKGIKDNNSDINKSSERTIDKADCKKQSLFSRIFGKKADSAKEQVVYVNPEAKPKTNDIRDEILQVTNDLYAKGLLTGIGGNISARCEDNPNHVWITPSSVFKGDLRADMMVRIDLDGNNVTESDLSASSEKMVHLAIYKRRPEVMSVVHSHAPKATLMALTNLKFQPISTDAAFIGDVPVVPFLIPGSPELGDMVGDAIGADGSAVLMQNHGLVVAGNSPRRAADTTEVVELTAEKLLECYALKIQPVIIPPEAQEELASIGKMLV